MPLAERRTPTSGPRARRHDTPTDAGSNLQYSGQEQRKNRACPAPASRLESPATGKAGRAAPRTSCPRCGRSVNAVLEGNEAAIQEADRRAVLSPKTVLQCLELAAKLNREVGPTALPLGLEADGPVKVILGWGDGD